MKQLLTSIYIISLLCSSFLFSQQDSIPSTFGIRVGCDLSKFAKTAFISDYKTFEVNADFLLSKRYAIAFEYGSENRQFDLPSLGFSSQGNYIKLGVDYNMYENWLHMNNAIYAGFRYGQSAYEMGIQGYELYNPYNYWNEELTMQDSMVFDSLSSGWVEILLGVKAEVLTNVFLGFNVQLKSRVFDKTPEDYPALYIPGFGQTYADSKFGVGFGYSLSYLIPIPRAK